MGPRTCFHRQCDRKSIIDTGALFFIAGYLIRIKTAQKNFCTPHDLENDTEKKAPFLSLRTFITG